MPLEAVISDIETGPLPDDELSRFFDFDPSKVKDCELIGQTFDPSSVKHGNTKDEAKRAEKEESERAKFEQAKAAAIKAMKSGESDQFAELKGRAALSPITGRVLCIGFYSLTKDKIKIIEGDEPDLLAVFWEQYSKIRESNRSIIGHNFFGFDLPFMVRRSLILRVDVPRTVYQLAGRYVNWDKMFQDTMQAWQMGQFGSSVACSLHEVSRAFGLKGKKDKHEVTGENFYKFYWGTQEERALALKYLEGDLKDTAFVAERLGLCEGVKRVNGNAVEKFVETKEPETVASKSQ